MELAKFFCILTLLTSLHPRKDDPFPTRLLFMPEVTHGEFPKWCANHGLRALSQGVTQEALVGSVAAWLPCVKPRHGGSYSCYTEIGVVSSSLCKPSLCGPALFQSASWLIHKLCNLCSNQDRIMRPMCTLFIHPQLPLKVTSYHNLSASKPWTYRKFLENSHDKTSWFSFENLYIWTSLAE